MITRILSSVVLLPPVIAAIWFGGLYFDALMILMGVVAIVEWCRICSGNGYNVSTIAAPVLFIAVVVSFLMASETSTISILITGILILAATGKMGSKPGFWPVFGYFYVAIAVISLLWMRGGGDGGRYLIILLL